jgi:hypothetical protein
MASIAAIGSDRDHEASGALTFIGSAIGSVGGWYMASRTVESSAFGATVIMATSAALGGTLMYRVTRTRRSSVSALRVVPFAGDTVGLSVGTMW